MKEKYTLKVGHKGDMFFATTLSSKTVLASKDYMIAHVFYSKEKCEKWMDEMNEVQSYREH